jgi:hypothetical protein
MVIAIAALQILLVFLQKAILINANSAARQMDMNMFIMTIFLPFLFIIVPRPYSFQEKNN